MADVWKFAFEWFDRDPFALTWKVQTCFHEVQHEHLNVLGNPWGVAVRDYAIPKMAIEKIHAPDWVTLRAGELICPSAAMEVVTFEPILCAVC
jgi:hypothetical protein